MKGLGLRKREALAGYGFIALWVIGFLAFLVWPLMHNIQQSFTDASLAGQSEVHYIGLSNYIEAFTVDVKFVPYLLNTLRNLVIDVPVILVFSLAVALLAMQPVPGTILFRAIFFLPVVIGSAAVVGHLFDTAGNQVVLFRGAGVQQFLQIYLGKHLPAFLTFLNRSIFVLWRSGVQILIFIAGLKGIDPTLYEAAKVDGASPWSSFWKITLPMLSPVMLINIIYTIIDSFTDYFNEVMRYIRQVTFETDLRLGYPSAMGTIYFVLIFLLVAGVFLIINKFTFYRGERS